MDTGSILGLLKRNLQRMMRQRQRVSTKESGKIISFMVMATMKTAKDLTEVNTYLISSKALVSTSGVMVNNMKDFGIKDSNTAMAGLQMLKGSRNAASG